MSSNPIIMENWRAEISNHKQKKHTPNNSTAPTHLSPTKNSISQPPHSHLLQELLLGGKTPTHVLRRALEQHSNYSDAEQPSSNKRTVVMVCGTFPLPVIAYTASSVPSNPNPTLFFVYRLLAGRYSSHVWVLPTTCNSSRSDQTFDEIGTSYFSFRDWCSLGGKFPRCSYYSCSGWMLDPRVSGRSPNVALSFCVICDPKEKRTTDLKRPKGMDVTWCDNQTAESTTRNANFRCKWWRSQNSRMLCILIFWMRNHRSLWRVHWTLITQKNLYELLSSKLHWLGVCHFHFPKSTSQLIYYRVKTRIYDVPLQNSVMQLYYIQNNLVRNKGLQNGILYHPFSTSSKTQVHSINLIATTWEVHNIDLRFTDPSSSEWLPTYSGWLETCACYGEAVPTSRTLGESCLFHYFRSSAWRGTSKKEPGTKMIPKK